ncbi:LOW QUALITY PROTEIN: cysteine-rich receptor-like protein kinase 44 [Rhodamnia argentea]|uniref:LOW QUALITY PROTEIN: cysteine-rich receptor-like protein kinase 44 n=1 Tax=Rhodamnia argentea TaxID=178133 RepID=A0A8B8N016_9MYRT|nr:LOW QUALITY PROTEIN: cysteine-rich receptor-like protein kinase 44 [Rhodamnia argentea]
MEELDRGAGSEGFDGDVRSQVRNRETVLPNFQTMFALLQCSPDLSPLDCQSCLWECINDYQRCCHGKQGGGVNKPSCIFRWDLYPFFESDPGNPPSSPPPPAPVAKANPPAPPPAHAQVTNGGKSNWTRTVIIAVTTSVSGLLVTGVVVLLMVRRKKKQQARQRVEGEVEDEISTVESLQFDFGTIRAATDDFSNTKKLGQGGFGAVYRGRLSNGQEIAVKRLSQNSGQGETEFKNEVMLLARLQHRNLVRLLGFCLEGVERLLIYEFVPNSSLDQFIFDSLKRANLDWNTRHKIIMGVARGLLYLHEGSRLRIIHRDLKAGNILLDSDMNPKISDFGMARLFELDQSQAETNRIVGTYGYMPPEYAMRGNFSVKSDVFSFGVLVLEIVSGQRNNLFRVGDDTEVLIGYVWKSWRDGTISNIIDSSLTSGSSTEIARCIQIGLLCVQENMANRPTMTSVLLMLNSHSFSLQVPSQPAFFIHGGAELDMPSTQDNSSRVHGVSKNEVSMTELYPR